MTAAKHELGLMLVDVQGRVQDNEHSYEIHRGRVQGDLEASVQAIQGRLETSVQAAQKMARLELRTAVEEVWVGGRVSVRARLRGRVRVTVRVGVRVGVRVA